MTFFAAAAALASGCSARVSALAANDLNLQAVSVFQSNFPTVAHCLERDLTAFPPAELAALLGQKHVDVAVGGPPCHGFSNFRQRDGGNRGERMVKDERRQRLPQRM